MPRSLISFFQHYQGLEEAVYRNINACKEMATVMRTSFGPSGKVMLRGNVCCTFKMDSTRFTELYLTYAISGLNKMIVNHLDKLFITNDSATIMSELEVSLRWLYHRKNDYLQVVSYLYC